MTEPRIAHPLATYFKGYLDKWWLMAMSRALLCQAIVFALFPIFTLAGIIGYWQFASRPHTQSKAWIYLWLFCMVYVVIKSLLQIQACRALKNNPWRVIDFETEERRPITHYLSWGKRLNALPLLSMVIVIVIEALVLLWFLLVLHSAVGLTGLSNMAVADAKAFHSGVLMGLVVIFWLHVPGFFLQSLPILIYVGYLNRLLGNKWVRLFILWLCIAPFFIALTGMWYFSSDVSANEDDWFYSRMAFVFCSATFLIAIAALCTSMISRALDLKRLLKSEPYYKSKAAAQS